MTFFPKHTLQWEEPTSFRRLSISLWEMAVVTGIVLRLYRALAVTYAPASSWLWTGGTFLVALVLLCAMLTLHLANFPMHQWWWRAPAFALLEAAAESVTALFLIWAGREPSGSVRAEWADWLPMAGSTLWTRGVTVCLWALLLAGMVWLVRRTVLREEPVEDDPVDDPVEDAAQA